MVPTAPGSPESPGKKVSWECPGIERKHCREWGGHRILLSEEKKYSKPRSWKGLFLWIGFDAVISSRLGLYLSQSIVVTMAVFQFAIYVCGLHHCTGYSAVYPWY